MVRGGVSGLSVEISVRLQGFKDSKSSESLRVDVRTFGNLGLKDTDPKYSGLDLLNEGILESTLQAMTP